jgi:hypothetical protein
MKKYVIVIFLFFAVACVINGQEVLPVRSGELKKGSGLRVSSDSSIINDTKAGLKEIMSDSVPLIDSISAQSMEKEYAKARLSERAKQDSIRNSQRIYGWKISPRLGERMYVEQDTSNITFHQKTLVDGKDVAVSYLGSVGSASQSKIFFNRPETSRFTFMDVFSYWRKNPEDQVFLNTKVPYSNIFYQESGSKQVAENRFTGTLSSNFGKKFNIGMDVDYIYARGFYANLANKSISYDLNASYIGDKYSMHTFFGFNNLNTTENGGIQDTGYITNPDAYTSFSGRSQEIPVWLNETWNRLRGRHFYMTHRYNLGDDEEVYQVNDSTTSVRKKKDYVAPASIVLTTHYNDHRRTIKSNNSYMDSLFYYKVPSEYKRGYAVDENGNTTEIPVLADIKYTAPIDDYMSFYSLKNTLALAMNEGFRDWVKFGLTAFVEYDMRKYSIPYNLPKSQTHASENIVTIGGVLSKDKGKYLTYRAMAEANLTGGEEYRLEGEITTKLFLKEREFSAKAKAYVKNIKPSYFENNFSSKYWNWNYDFDYTNRLFVGGEIASPSTKTKISGGFERISNYIYYNKDGFIEQASDVNVFSIRLDQQMKVGILHWDNQLVYQKSSSEEVLPLPDLSLYSNLYITGTIAKVLHLQLGADVHFHTEYYAPGYNLLTLQFYNQRETKLGNFPLTTAYLNLLLKNTRFFIMYYNATQGMGNSQSFAVPNYPLNSTGIRLGLSWKFNN